MAFRGKVYHDIELFFFKQVVDIFPVGDVPLGELKVGIFHGLFQGFQIAGVGQQVQTHNVVIRVIFQHIVHKVAADKSGCTGDTNLHGVMFLSQIPWFTLQR